MILGGTNASAEKDGPHVGGKLGRRLHGFAICPTPAPICLQLRRKLQQRRNIVLADRQGALYHRQALGCSNNCVTNHGE
jgi:hypothetical protein